MTTDVRWRSFEEVNDHPDWATLKSRIEYMMRLKGWKTAADLGRNAGIPPRQMANTMDRFDKGGDVYLDTIRKIQKALGVRWDWLLDNEGMPNAAIEELVSGPTRRRSTPPPPASHNDTDHRTPAQHPPARRLTKRSDPTK